MKSAAAKPSALKQCYQNDPSASGEGSMRVSAPEPIRMGRLIIDLCEAEAPKAVANFKALCTGEKGMSKESKKPLHYKGNPFHRIQTGQTVPSPKHENHASCPALFSACIDLNVEHFLTCSPNLKRICTGCPPITEPTLVFPEDQSTRLLCTFSSRQCVTLRFLAGFVAQGGDVTRFDGSGGESIYGKKFNDEKDALKLKHDRAGIVSMANSGKNSNSSQFFITLDKAPQCDGKHVVVGRIQEEGLEIVKKIAACASADGTPTQKVVIADCGVL